MATGTFSQYRHNATLEGAEIREVPHIDGEHDLDGMLAAIDENTAVVWICTPNNPTGKYIPEQKLIAFLEKVPERCIVVLDEAYQNMQWLRITQEQINGSINIKILLYYEPFRKFTVLASLRVGYGIADEDIIQKARAFT